MNIIELPKGKGHFDRCKSYQLKGLKHFNVHQIALSGQAFRFTYQSGEPVREYKPDEPVCVVAFREYCEVFQKDEYIEMVVTDDLYYWLNYFDIIDCGNEVTSYDELLKRIGKSDDNVLKEAAGYSDGIRILHQDFLETAISFITSSCNNIPRITQLINRFCKCFGDFKITNIDDYEVSYWTFPTIKQLREQATEEKLRELGFGFRAKGIMEFINYYSSLPLEFVPSSYDLQTVRGIGPKVADCILLYSFHKLNCVPMDVWMKRFETELYDGQLAWKEFSPYCGICQQYLYYHYRPQGGTKNDRRNND